MIEEKALSQTGVLFRSIHHGRLVGGVAVAQLAVAWTCLVAIFCLLDEGGRRVVVQSCGFGEDGILSPSRRFQ